MRAIILAKILLAMILWAACFPLLTIGIKFAPHLAFATLRALIAGLILVGLAMALGRPSPKGVRTWLTLALIGLGATSLGFLGMFHAAELVSPGIATVIANSQPLLAAGLAGVVLGERLTLRGKVGLSLGFSGIVMIAAPGLFAGAQSNYIIGVSYIVLAALGITVSNIVLKRIAATVDPLMTIGWQFLIGAVPLAILSASTETPLAIDWSISFIVVLITLSVLGSALVYVLWMSVLSEVALSQANAFSFLVPFFGLTMGVLFYNEMLSAAVIFGIGLAVAGVALVSRNGVVDTADLVAAE
ncbi:DMT family transporter [Sulfitobacter geojensis]|uniref:DMT family transporter n=1 Tax=Sulfitobacter geojensis TaxID=1342299 RepID=UPI0036DA58ED